MKIGIVGLGLIGGSVAKAIKKNTQHSVYATDINKETIRSAMEQEAIDGEITPEELKKCDVAMICLYPEATVEFIRQNADNFRKDGIVIDSCGIKTAVVYECEKILAGKNVNFLGCHPMAGREFSGFDYSVDNLFDRASFIIAQTPRTNTQIIAKVGNLAYEMGFYKVVVTTPEEHDKVIAFTSQLAHIVSSAYVKSPSLMKQAGFSAGSFKDLTRVAKLNEEMWTSLFLLNREPLIDEIAHIIQRLEEYKKALEEQDAEGLKLLLKNGRELKELSNNMSGESGQAGVARHMTLQDKS